MRFTLFFALLLALLSHPQQAIFGQTGGNQQQIDYEYVHSPHKASIYSAVLPGLGQFYNKKYWKIPIVYAGFGAIGYFALDNRKEYRKANEAYIYVFNEETYPINNDYIGRYDAEALRNIRDFYRRNMELNFILLGLWYGLNIIDATVDAHFFNYDVSDNLNVKLKPTIMPDFAAVGNYHPLRGSAGISLKFSF